MAGVLAEMGPELCGTGLQESQHCGGSGAVRAQRLFASGGHRSGSLCHRSSVWRPHIPSHAHGPVMLWAEYPKP